MSGDHGIERRLRMEVIPALADDEPRERGEAARRSGRVVRVGVDPGPDSGPAERHDEQLGLPGPGPPDRLLDLAGIAAELLPESHRCRVLEVGSPGLHDRPQLVGLGVKYSAKGLERRNQILFDGERGGELHRGRDRVVRRLALVHVVVRVDRSPGQTLGREVRHDLVHVRVRRRARSGLVDVDRELVVVPAVGDLGRRGGDRLGKIPIEQTELGVRLGRSFLDERQGPDEFARKALARDREVQDSALRGCAVPGVGRDLHLTHRVALDPSAGAVVWHGRIVCGPTS